MTGYLPLHHHNPPATIIHPAGHLTFLQSFPTPRTKTSKLQFLCYGLHHLYAFIFFIIKGKSSVKCYTPASHPQHLQNISLDLHHYLWTSENSPSTSLPSFFPGVFYSYYKQLTTILRTLTVSYPILASLLPSFQCSSSQSPPCSGSWNFQGNFLVRWTS